MVTVLSVTEGKNKVIVSGLVGASSTLVFLTVIHIAAKIAIIVTAVAVTYALLSLIHTVVAKFAKTAEISKNEGYGSVNKGKEVSLEEPKRTETELEELKNKRAQERMEKGSLDGPINAFGELIIENTECSHSVDYTKTMVMPEKIILDMSDDRNPAQNNSSSVKNQMKSLPEHMDVSGNPLPEQLPSDLTNIGLGSSKSTQKLSAADWLLQYGNVNNDVRKVLEQPITLKEFNELRFNR